MKQKNISINYLLVFLIMILVVLEVFILNFHSTTGDKLTIVNKEIEVLETDNYRIGKNIASYSSMLIIANKAQEQGLAQSTKILSLGTSFPLASNLKLSF